MSNKKSKKTFKKLLTLRNIYAIIKYRKNKERATSERVAKVETLKHLKELLAEVKETVFEVNGVKMKQTQRNDLKDRLVTAIMNDLAEEGVVVGRSKEGVVIGLENDNEGVIYSTLDAVIKNFDYDSEWAISEYDKIVESRRKREEERLAKKQSAQSAKAKG